MELEKEIMTDEVIVDGKETTAPRVDGGATTSAFRPSVPPPATSSAGNATASSGRSPQPH